MGFNFSAAVRQAAGASLIAVLLAACSGIPRYQDPFPTNLHVRTELDPGTIFSSTVVAFDVYKVRSDCDYEYRGRVSLDNVSTNVGMPVDETVYLDFVFTTRKGEVRHGTLLTARPDQDYEAVASYSKGMYNVVIRETARGNTRPRLAEKRPANRCNNELPDSARRKAALDSPTAARQGMNG